MSAESFNWTPETAVAHVREHVLRYTMDGDEHDVLLYPEDLEAIAYLVEIAENDER